jgi:hypothetical protein
MDFRSRGDGSDTDRVAAMGLEATKAPKFPTAKLASLPSRSSELALINAGYGQDGPPEDAIFQSIEP